MAAKFYFFLTCLLASNLLQCYASCNSTCLTCDGSYSDDCLTCDTSGIYKYFICANRKTGSTNYACSSSPPAIICDPTCCTCNGTAPTNCLTCNLKGVYPYFMKTNNTCTSICPTTGGYFTNSGGTCKPCDSSCLTCDAIYRSSCLTCNTSGTNPYFICANRGAQFSNYVCSSSPPAIMCDPTCCTCNGTAPTNCLTCNLKGVYPYFMKTNNTCTSICPTTGGYFINSSGTCKLCNSTCLTCNGAASTNCLTCNTSGAYPYFMNTNKTCISACPTNGYYNQKDSICYACSTNCTTCVNIATNCLSCPINFYLDTNQTDQVSKYCRLNIIPSKTAGTLYLNETSPNANLIFNYSLLSANLPNIQALFILGISNFTLDDFTYTITQLSETNILFAITPIKTINHNILTVIIPDTSKILDNESNPISDQVNPLELGYYDVNSQIEAAQTAATYVALVIVGFSIPLALTGELGALWGLLDILQMLYYYIFLNMNVPQNFINFLLLLKFSQFPLPNLGKMISEKLVLRYNMTMPDENTYTKFEEQNLNAFFLTNGAFIGCYIILAVLKTNLLKYLKRLVKKCSKTLFLKHIVNRIKWSFVIRYILISILQLAFAIALQFTNFSFETSLGITSNVLAGLMLIFIIFFASWMIHITSLKGYRYRYNEKKFSEKFGSLTDEYHILRSKESFIVRNFTFIIFIRKITFVSIIVLGYQSCIAILIFLLIQSIFMFKLVITELPYDRETFNSKTIFQELVFSSLNVILMMNETEIIADVNGQVIAGWVMIGICMIMLIYDLFFVVKDQLIAWKNTLIQLKKVCIWLKNIPRIKEESQSNAQFRVSNISRTSSSKRLRIK